MAQPHIPLWIQRVVAVMGAGGICLVTFLDSSVLSFPFVADALVIELSYSRPARMPLYAALATLGSLAGCIWLYLLAKKGGEAYFARHARSGASRARRWVGRHAFLSAFIPAILPPPMPFKAFVLAEGLFQVPLRTFTAALLSGRGLRYVAEGILAIYFGKRVLTFLAAHGRAFTISAVLAIIAVYFASRLLFRSGRPSA